MKIFITGATGFVGQAVMRYLLPLNHELFILFRSEKTFTNEFRLLVKQTKATLVQGDVLQPDSLSLIQECDVCLFLACNSKWGTLETPSTTHVAVNGTSNALKLFGRAKRFVYVSSAAAMMFDEGFDSQ